MTEQHAVPSEQVKDADLGDLVAKRGERIRTDDGDEVRNMFDDSARVEKVDEFPDEWPDSASGRELLEAQPDGGG